LFRLGSDGRVAPIEIESQYSASQPRGLSSQPAAREFAPNRTARQVIPSYGAGGDSLCWRPCFIRANHFVNLGCHGLGVLDKAVRLKCRHFEEHGLAEDGKTVAPNFSDFNK